MTEPKRLQRDVEQGMIGGVAAGFAQYFGVDATVVRVIFVVLLIISFGVMLLAYLAMWLLVPPMTQAVKGDQAALTPPRSG